MHAASRSSLAPSLAAAPALHWQDTAVPAADAAGCLETASMELTPIVMVMGQGTETQAGKGHSDTITAAVCVLLMAVVGMNWPCECGDVTENTEGDDELSRIKSK